MAYRKLKLLSTAAALLVPSMAAAQGAAVDGSSDNEVGIADIIVTAERREVSVQKTALNISVIGSDTLIKQGITDSRALLDSIPGLKMNMANPNAYIGLYGLASAGGGQYADAVMAFNYGGVTLSRQTSANSAFYDLERVEVLKGPQGTLYGRNATVGAINIIPARPTDEFAGGASITFGSYKTVNTTGYINIPLSDTVSSRVAFQTTRHDGYYSNGLDDANNYGLRASLKFTPSDDLSILLWGDVYLNRSRGPYGTFQFYLNNTERWINNDPWFGIGTPGSCTNQLLCPTYAAPVAGGINVVGNPSGFTSVTGPYAFGNLPFVGGDGKNNTDQYLLSAEINYNTSIGKLTVIPSYVRTKIDYKTYSNGLIFGNNTKASQFSLEARLSSDNDGRLQYTLGGFYMRERQDALQYNTQSSGYALLVTPNYVDKNYAFFGELTYSLTDALRVSGGLRYTNETKTQDGYTTTTGQNAAQIAIIRSAGGTCTLGGTPAAPSLFLGVWAMPSDYCLVPNGGRYNDGSMSYKLGLEYDIGQDAMLYATFRTGYRAGGFTVGTGNDYAPEKPRTYEIGLRSRLLDRRLQLNMTGFYWDYRSQQISQLRLYKVGGVDVGQTAYPFNYDGKFYGAEADVVALLTPQTRLKFNVLWTKGTYDSTPAVAAFNQVALVPQFNLPRINLPEWTIGATLNHSFETSSGASIVPEVRMHYEGRAVLRILDPLLLTPGEIRDAYAKFDASLTYNAPEGRWSVQAYVNNITNRAVVGVGSSGQVSLPTFFRPSSNPTGVRSATLDPPRTFGLRLTGKF
jgi:iron complex outermembrane recepter protein